MSADYGTEHFKGYGHLDRTPPYIHVVHRNVKVDDWHGGGEYPLGSFSREEIAELVELGEQAWPGLAAELATAARTRTLDS